jgi:hypothetical protein
MGRYLQTGERHMIGKGREVACKTRLGEIRVCSLKVSEMFVGRKRKFVGAWTRHGRTEGVMMGCGGDDTVTTTRGTTVPPLGVSCDFWSSTI